MAIKKRECRLCGGSEFKEVINFGYNPLVNALLDKKDLKKKEKTYPLVVEQCQDCRLVQIVEPVKASKVYQDQDYLYYTGDMPQNSQYMMSFNSLVKSIEDFSAPNDLIVEIGSNDGTVIKKITDRRLLGVDPATNVVIRALAKGVPTLSAFFNKHNAELIKQEFGQAKVVGGANCLAHIDDIHGILDGVEILLKDDGIFWVECNYWGGMVKSNHYALIYHDHYSYFTLKNWVDLLVNHGIKVFDAMITEAQGDNLSLRLFASKSEFYEATPRFKELLASEEESKLASYETCVKYREGILAEAQKLHDLIQVKRSSNNHIAGYGAAAKGFSVLKLANIDGSHIDYFVDDSPAKQGKYTPVTHIPVVSRQSLTKMPDIFFITAPNYENVIVEKEKEFLANGGHFITIDGRII